MVLNPGSIAVEAVLLDVGGVLAMPDTTLIRGVLAAHGLEADDERLDRTAYLAVKAFDSAEGDDEVLERAFIAAYVSELGMEENDANLTSMRSALFVPAWPARVLGNGARWLRALADTGVRIAIVSNAPTTVEEWLRDAKLCQVGPGPGTEVEAIITSEGAGFSKPDPRIFQLALNGVGVSPENAVHVGDSLRADVRGAQGAGVTPVHFDPYGLCLEPDHQHVTSLAEVVEMMGRVR